MEVWKPIPGFEGYEVSDVGQVRSYRKPGGRGRYKTPHILAPLLGSPGYFSVRLCKNRTSYMKTIASLVLLSFVGKRPDGLQVCHRNNIKTDNRLENLRYDSPQGNARDSRRLLDQQVVEMRERRAKGAKLETLAEHYKIESSHVGKICRGDNYSDVNGPITKDGSKLTENQVSDIRQRRTAGELLKHIAADYDISAYYAGQVARGLYPTRYRIVQK